MSRDGSRWSKADRRPGAVAALSPLLRYTFDVRGYLLFEHALDEATVARLRAVIDRQGVPPGDETIQGQRFGNDGRMFAWDHGSAT